MTIILRDIRTAVQNYLDTHVTVTISPLSPASGNTIQPNEYFTFSVTATNSSAVDAIRLVNVRYYVTVLNPAVGKLVVPDTNPDSNGIRYRKPGPVLGLMVDCAPKEEVGTMYVFPPASVSSPPFVLDRAGDLDVGDSDTIQLRGKAGTNPSGGNTQITCKILAEPDLDFLFPKNEDSSTATRPLIVIG